MAQTVGDPADNSDRESSKSLILERILDNAQRVGALTDVPIAEIIRHSQWFTEAIPTTAKTVVDLGSGAGIPGLVVALDRPDLEILLVDRRRGRVDDLLRSISALDLAPRVKVLCSDISAMIRDPKWIEKFDVAVSRGLGPPEQSIMFSRRLVKPGGAVVISEPPPGSASRWDTDFVYGLGLDGPVSMGSVAVFHVKHSYPLPQ